MDQVQQYIATVVAAQALDERYERTEEMLEELATQVRALVEAKKSPGQLCLDAGGKALTWSLVALGASIGAALSLSSPWTMDAADEGQVGRTGWSLLAGAPAGFVVAVLIMAAFSFLVFFVGQTWGRTKAETTKDRWHDDEIVAMGWWNGVVVGLWSWACLVLWFIAAVLVFERLGGVVFDKTAAPASFTTLASAVAGAHVRMMRASQTMQDPAIAITSDS